MIIVVKGDIIGIFDIESGNVFNIVVGKAVCHAFKDIGNIAVVELQVTSGLFVGDIRANKLG